MTTGEARFTDERLSAAEDRAGEAARLRDRYESLVRVSAQVVWTTDPEGAVNEDSPSWRAYTGQTLDEWRGWGWLDAIHPDDRERTRQEWGAAVAARSPVEIEYRVRHVTGEWRWMLVRAVPVLEPDGRIREWVGMNADIHDRRTAAERGSEERAALETLERVGRTLAAELRLDRVVQAATDACTQLSGAKFGAFFYNAINEQGEAYMLYSLSGAPREAFERFPLPRNTKVFEPTFRGNGIVRSDDITKDPRYGQNPPHRGMPRGHLPLRSYLAVPVASRSGEVFGGLFFGHPDAGVFSERSERLVVGIAAQAAIAIENARLYERVEAALRTRDEFLSSAAHDLKTPLTAIRGMAQLLARRSRTGPLEPRRLEDGLSTIDSSAEQMTEQLDELVDLTRVQLGEPLPLRVGPVDLAKLVARAAATAQRAAPRHRIAVEAGRPVIGTWDAARITRVIHNLVDNAVKFSPRGGTVTVSATTEKGADGATLAVVRVIDEGVGIPAEELPKVFERFHRASNVTGRIPGAGIGLASAKRIVEQHGGTIAVSSAEGRGSTFTVRLPLEAARQPDA